MHILVNGQMLNVACVSVVHVTLLLEKYHNIYDTIMNQTYNTHRKVENKKKGKVHAVWHLAIEMYLCVPSYAGYIKTKTVWVKSKGAVVWCVCKVNAECQKHVYKIGCAWKWLKDNMHSERCHLHWT